MSHPRVLTLCAALGAAALLTACTSSDRPAAEPSPTVAPVAEDLAALTIDRTDFCDRLDQLVLREGVPAEPATGHSLVAWTNGDRIEGAADGELSHEYGCRWTAAGSTTDVTAAAWVFAPPVTPARAATSGKALVTKACRPLSGAAATFGVHPVAVACTPTGKPEVVRWAGLFGDAWLVCETTGAEATTRAAAFCPAVITALASSEYPDA